MLRADGTVVVMLKTPWRDGTVAVEGPGPRSRAARESRDRRGGHSPGGGRKFLPWHLIR